MTLPEGIDLIYRFNPEGQFIYVNENAREVFNLPKEEILGKSYLHFVREDFQEKVVRFYQQQIRERQHSTYFEFPFVVEGRETWIGQSIELVCEGDKVIELLGVARPISELREVKAHLRESDQQLLTLLTHIDAAILIEDAHSEIRYANEKFAQYFRLKEHGIDLVGKNGGEIARHIAPQFIEPEAFVQDIHTLIDGQYNRLSQRLALLDERVMERDYIPMFQDEEYAGHLWVYRDITLKSLTEQALQESEQKYREVIQNIDLGLMEVNNDETILWANESFLQSTGYQLKEIQGKHAPEVFLTEEDKKFTAKKMAETQALRSKGESSVYELPIRHRNGEQLWMMISGAPIKDISGQVIGSLGIHHNISPLKSLQKQLEYRLQLQTILLQLANALISIEKELEPQVIQKALSKLGSFVQADRVYIFDYDLDKHSTSNTYEWCGKGISPEIDNLQDVPLDALPDWIETHRNGKPMIYDRVLDLPKDHPVREILEPQGIQSIITFPIFGNGKLHGFIGFDAVQTLKQWSDDERELLEFMAQMLAGHYIRKEVELKLSASELRMRTILENALDAVITINEEGIVESWNHQAEVLFKYSEVEAKGEKLSKLIIPDKFAAAHDRGIKHYIETGEGPVLNQRIELVGHDKAGNHFPIELSIVPFKIDGKHYFSSFLNDITDRKQAEEDMAAALEQQKELAKMKSRLISMASHEFRTPLTTIKANADMLEMWTNKIPEEYQAKALKYLERLNRETNRLSNIMTDILALGRLESGRSKIKMRSIDLVSFAQDLKDRHFAPYEDGRNLVMKLRGGPQLVSGDTEMLEHIIQNLVNNAFKYSPQAEPPEMLIDFRPSKVRLSVKDHGIGIPEEEQGNIFNSFYRAENTRGIQGSGMGLSLVKQMCDMHNLNLRFFSAEGEGSEFVIDIPLNQ